MGVSAGRVSFAFAAVEVLVVDDMDEMRILVRVSLRAAGFVVGEATSGAEALALIDQLNPMVVVVDETLPGMSGLETARQILQRRPDQLIVLFSASLNQRLGAAAVGVGVAACVSKLRYQDLVPAVQALVSSGSTGCQEDFRL